MRHETLINKEFAIQLTDKCGCPSYDLALCVTIPALWRSPNSCYGIVESHSQGRVSARTDYTFIIFIEIQAQPGGWLQMLQIKGLTVESETPIKSHSYQYEASAHSDNETSAQTRLVVEGAYFRVGLRKRAADNR
jgi:hypothetical protein